MHTYWKHKKSGKVYAICLNDEGVDSAYGPIPFYQIESRRLLDWDYDKEDGLWVQSLIEEFEDIGKGHKYE